MECINPKTIWPHRSIEWVDSGKEEKPLSVPCGKCVACLVNKRTDWSFRLAQEHKVSKSAHFVTLTYDQKHLRTNQSLCKKDLQLYLKRLRKKDESTRIRYYAVGEYGTKHGRPHYHLLLFNSREEHIRSAWTDSNGNSIGLVHVGKVTPASIAYTTKYVIQPMGKLCDGYERPFATMSRAYGIGGNYLTDEMVDWHRTNEATYTVLPGNVKGRLPRFYASKIWYNDADKERIQSKSLSHVLDRQRKVEKFYSDRYGARADEQKHLSETLMLQRVKIKVQYSQTM